MVCREKPGCDGFHMPFLTICLSNGGVEKIPDIYHREGFHVINLQNHKWNECVWEFPDLPRDKVTELSFALDCHGTEQGGHKDFVFDIADIRLERAEDSDVSLGWQGNSGTISFSTTGYWTSGRKVAVANQMSGAFRLLNESGKTVYTGDMKPLQNEKGDFGILDFTEFEALGRYRLQAGEYTTEPIAIGDDALLEIARDQLYWEVGKNPFRQSLIYGEGSNYAQQYATLCGETMGELPVGIQARANEDVPYWPMANNATYKEIWMTSVGHWLRLLADLY